MSAHRISRRQFMAASGAGAAAMAAPSHNARTLAAREKPNLLFLWTDEQRRDTMAAYGNRRIHTPNLNQLGREAAVFRRAYCTQPVCTPARCSVLTGLWPHQTGSTVNNIPLPATAKCLPELLNDPEYRCAYMGKWHLGDEVFPQHGFDTWVSTEDGYQEYYSSGRDPEAASSYHAFLKNEGYAPDYKKTLYSRGFCSRLPLQDCKPAFLEREARAFLHQHRNEPFMLYVNFLEPHMPFNGPLNDEHDPADVTLPENFLHALEDDDPLRNRLFRQWYFEKGWEGRPLKTEADWRLLLARYWGLVTQVDLSVGRILNTLEELGLAENTIVVYTSDHGEMMGAHGLLAKTYSYEESSGIPFLMRLPGTSSTPQIVDTPVSLIDVVPTLLDALGKPEMCQGLPGQSLLPALKGGPLQEDHAHVEWNTFEQNITFETPPQAAPEDVARAIRAQWRMVVSPDGWKLCLASGDKSQLFNLNTDPFEKLNLFYTGRHQDVIDRLTKRIHEWQRRVGDTLAV
jgi:arylsulfatase